MDLNLGSSEKIEGFSDVLINICFKLLDFDFRTGLFTDSSSIFDLSPMGLKDEHYEELAKTYAGISAEQPELSYSQGQAIYFKLLSKKFKMVIQSELNSTFSVDVDLDHTHLLVEIAELVSKKNPSQNWCQENKFIFKTFQTRLDRQQAEIDATTPEENPVVVRLPVHKKRTPEDILNGFNDYLMVTELGMDWTAAKALATENYNKAMQGKRFTPPTKA